MTQLNLAYRTYDNRIIMDLSFDDVKMTMFVTNVKVQYDEYAGPVYFFSDGNGFYFSITPNLNRFFYDSNDGIGLSMSIENVRCDESYINDIVQAMVQINPRLRGGRRR